MKLSLTFVCFCCVALQKIPAAELLGKHDAAAATPLENPYQVIVERNVFALNPEPQPAPVEPPKPDLPDIKLSGFVEVGGSVRALFASMPKNPKEQPLYYNLAQGETDGILQVVKIDFNHQEADIINSGTPMRLTMKQDGFKETPSKVVAHNPVANPRQFPSARPPMVPIRPST
jgi:hypothetical protein